MNSGGKGIVIKFFRLWFVALLPFASNAQVESLTVMTYNMLNFPSNSSARTAHFKNVLQEIQPDIFVAQEIESDLGAKIILSAILHAFSLEYEAGDFVQANFLNNAVFYKRDRVTLESTLSLSTDLREINGYEFSIDNHADSTFRWTLFATHLKASMGPDYAHRRWLEVARLQAYIAGQDSTYHYGFAGDFNFYDHAEPGYTLLMDSMSVDLIDPLNARGDWHDNLAYAHVHTQSTRTTRESDGGASGGLDDRFDFILLSHQMFGSGYPLTYVAGSYEAYGNDGQHFNKNINDAPVNEGIPNGMANALFGASDHLPVILRLSYPAVSATVDILADAQVLPGQPQLLSNYPNPFNPYTYVRFEIPKSTPMTLTVYNLLGQELARLHEGSIKGGFHEIIWNGRDGAGQSVASGLYIAVFVTPDLTQTIKMVLLK